MNINAKVTGIKDLGKICTRVTLETDEEMPVEIQMDFKIDDPRLSEFRQHHAWVRLGTRDIPEPDEANVPALKSVLRFFGRIPNGNA